MTRSERLRDAFTPWAGLVAGVVGGALAHQFGSEGTFNHCAVTSPIPLLVVALVCMAAAGAGAWASWRVARNDSEGASRRLIGVVSVGMAALALFSTILPMAASLLLPPCFQ